MLKQVLLFILVFFTLFSLYHAKSLNVLALTKTTGTVHTNLNAATTALSNYGSQNQWTVQIVSSTSLFDSKSTLLPYDVIIFCYTSGDILSDAQQTNFKSWFSSGSKGWVGFHSAAATEYDWSWYGGLVGTYIQPTQPSLTPQSAVLRIADRVHPSTSHLSFRWTITDTMFNFVNTSSQIRQKNHVLFDADERSFTGGTMGYDHPMAWCKLYYGGKAFYSALGDRVGAWSDPQFVAHITAGIAWAGGQIDGDCGATLDSSYSKETLFDFQSGEQPMHLAMLPSGVALFASRQGIIRAFNPATYQITVVAQLAVTTAFEDGLLGMLIDTQFAQTGFIFIYWSPAGQAQGTECNLLSRFTINSNTNVLNLGSRVDLLSVPVQRQECCHSGGSLNWDNDGNLVLTTGDNTNPFASGGYAPIDEEPGRAFFDSQRTSANSNDLRGKVLRINVSKTSNASPPYTIPQGNLFQSGPNTRAEIYAMGVRNPFRAAVDSTTGVTYVGDVGPDGAANPWRGPEGFDQLLVIPKNIPKNFGWPYCRANKQPYIDYNFATQQSSQPFDCSSPTNYSPNNNGLTKLPPASSASIWYPYSGSPEYPEMDSNAQGRASVAMHVFRPSDYNYNSTAAPYRMPDYFQNGTVLFADWARDYFREIKFDEQLNIVKINALWTSFTWKHPIDAIVSPDGSVYILEFGTDFVGDGASFSRIRYVGLSKVPTCVLYANATIGPLPLRVQFSGSKSTDPNGEAMTYSWDLNGDGVIDSTSKTAGYTYTNYGQYVAKLTVTNASGKSTSCTVQITPGNTPPVIKLRRPYIGSVVTYGVPTTYRMYVYDKEDGNTGSGTIPCSAVVSTPGLGHNDHVHDAIPIHGCNGTLVPAREDTIGEFFAILRVQYTDKGRFATPPLTSTLTVRFQPNVYEAENYDAMSGVQTEPTQDQLGYQDIGWIDDGDWTMYKNWNLQGIDSITLRVASVLSGNGIVTIRINSPTGPAIATAHIPLTGGWQNWADVTVPIQDTNQFFEVDLGATKGVTKLIMSCGTGQYPRGYDVYVSNNPDTSSRRYGYPIDWIVSSNGTSDVITVNFPANTQARFIKIVQTAKNAKYWTIKELNVYDQNANALARSGWSFRASKTAVGSSTSYVADGNDATLWSLGEAQRNGNVALYFMYSSTTPGQTGLFNLNYFTFNGVGAQG